MAQEQQPINIADIPALQAVAEEVVRTRKRQELTVDGQDLTIVVEPNRPKRSRISRGKRTSPDDPLWKIIGMARTEGATDVARNHDQYLAEWELSKMR